MTPPSGYSLIWSDEFNGTSLDTTKWKIYKNAQAVNVQNGYLRFHASTSSDQGGVDTAGKFEFKYGYVEARAKCANGNGYAGTDSQFWLMPQTGTYGSEGYHYEIDLLGQPSKFPYINRNAVMYRKWSGTGFSCNVTPCPWVWRHQDKIYDIKMSGTWHTYAFKWLSDQIIFYTDDVPIWTATGYISNENMHFNIALCIQTATGGCDDNNWGPFDSRSLPSEYLIDYVRVYQPTTLECPNPVLRMTI